MEDLVFRMMAYSDFQEFQAACLDSREELTEYLDLGKYMEFFIFTDYWSFFCKMLKEPDTNVYGLFEGKKLLGSAIAMPANRHFGAHLIGWIRHGYHRRGLASFYLEKLIDRCFQNGHLFVEMVIDQENDPSKRVAEKLGLSKIREWENAESGQGFGNSGRFVLYYAFSDRIKKLAMNYDLQPQEILDQLWTLEALGLVESPKMIQKPSQFGRNRISQNLRFLNMEKSTKLTDVSDSHETTLR